MAHKISMKLHTCSVLTHLQTADYLLRIENFWYKAMYLSSLSRIWRPGRMIL